MHGHRALSLVLYYTQFCQVNLVKLRGLCPTGESRQMCGQGRMIRSRLRSKTMLLDLWIICLDLILRRFGKPRGFLQTKVWSREPVGCLQLICMVSRIDVCGLRVSDNLPVHILWYWRLRRNEFGHWLPHRSPLACNMSRLVAA